MTKLDHGLIGNCAITALLDSEAKIVWSCFPRFDADPVFSRLLDNDRERGFFGIELEGFASAEQSYIHNTAILRTVLRTAHLIAAGALYGGHVYGVEAERLVPALAAILATGGAFLGLEVYQSSIWLIQVRGVATLAKLAMVAADLLSCLGFFERLLVVQGMCGANAEHAAVDLAM